MHANYQQIKEYLTNPEAYAAAAATPAAAADSGAGGGAAPAAAAAEPEEESDDDMVSADLTPHPPISERAPCPWIPFLPTEKKEPSLLTNRSFILFNSPPSFSMGLTGTLFLDSFHRVSISSAEQLLPLTWSHGLPFLSPSGCCAAVSLFTLSPDGPDRNICIFTISACLHGATLAGDHKYYVIHNRCDQIADVHSRSEDVISNFCMRRATGLNDMG